MADADYDDLPAELADLSALSRAFVRVLADGAARASPPPAAEREASYVVDRRGRRVPVRFDRITDRNRALCRDPAFGPPLLAIDCPEVTAEVVKRYRAGMTTRELDFETAAVCAQRALLHPDYDWLAARIHVSDLQKRTPASLAALVGALLAAAPERAGLRLTDEYIGVVRRGAAAIDARLDHARDYRFRLFGFQTLAGSYLARPAGKLDRSSLVDDAPMERPQHLYMRAALGVHACQADGRGHEAPEPLFAARLAAAFRLYDALSLQLVSNATPTLLNAGTGVGQLASCFQLAPGDDLASLFDALKDVALVSQMGGGVSVWLHGVRAEGARIRSTGGQSSGVRRYVRVLAETQDYVNQGGNRPGAFAAYLAVDHDDIFTFLRMARPKGELLAAPSLKFALWVPDLFMRRLLEQIERPDDPAAGDWHLFSPDTAPGLHLVYGAAYEALVARYVAEGRARRKVKAGAIIAEAFKSWGMAGTPYVLAKDHVNRKSNMANVAPVCSSNLCVAGGTLVLTSRGHLPIASLVGQAVEVWNGEAWSTAAVLQTGTGAPLLRVALDNGAALDCTPYHRFYTIKAGSWTAVEMLLARHLQPGDRLEQAGGWPVVADGGAPLAHAYTCGLFAADGHTSAGSRRRCRASASARGDAKTVRLGDGAFCGHHLGYEATWPVDAGGRCRATTGHNRISLCGEKKALLSELALHPVAAGTEYEDEDRLTVNLSDLLLPKLAVPTNADLPSRLAWFAGLCDGDGCVAWNGASASLRLASVELEFLHEVRLLLQTLGCDASVKLMRGAGRRVGKGGSANCRRRYRLLVSSRDLDGLLKLGFRPRRLDFRGAEPPARDARRFVRVASVAPLPGAHATYCFVEPLRHRGVFNGVLTGQCSEVVIPSWSEHDAPAFGAEHGETGVCVLGAVALDAFVTAGGLDFAGIADAAGLEVRALNRVIDVTRYPTEAGRRSSTRHRPIGVGVMGLADALARLGLAYGEPAAQALARGAAAALLFGALRESARLAEADGPYETFAGSPASEGLLQPDLWERCGHLAAGWEAEVEAATGGWLRPADWADLRARARRGLRNALLTAYMPTATTGAIAGKNESFEPFTTNCFVRKTLAGEFFVVNRALMAELAALGLWDERTRCALVAAGGSVQAMGWLPAALRRRYRTAREVHPSLVVRMAVAMAPFVDQSMSLNAYFAEPDLPKILRFLVEGWRAGLKTLSYYIHTAPAAGAQKSGAPAPPAGVALAAGAPEPDAAPAGAPRPDEAGRGPGCPLDGPIGPVCPIDGSCASCSV